jgi:sugar lactone lactonase YvrE
MPNIEPECVWEEPAVLGEGPVWVERENSLYWVDVVGKKVHRYGVADGARKSWTFDTEVTCLAPRLGGGFVGATRHAFACFDFTEDIVTPRILAEFETDLPGNRFNDGKADPWGRFWAGTVDEANWRDETGSLYRLDTDLSFRKIESGYICSNGPAFSLDNRTFYHNETMKGLVYAFDLGSDGEIRNKRPFVELESGEGGPDGITVDSEDCIWVCHFGGGRVTRFSPKGERMQSLRLPVPNVTSCTFAGSGLDTLYITTARYGMNEEEIRRHPLAGSLFACRPGALGLPTPFFAG